MKTYKPNEIEHFEKLKEPKLYTWDEIKREEGVYNLQGLETNVYLITIGNARKQFTTLHFYDNLEVAVGMWDDYRFTKLENAKVIFDVVEE